MPIWRTLRGLISTSRDCHIGERANPPENQHMRMTLGIAHLQPIVSLAAGVLILITPRFLNYIVAIFLILSGIIGLGFVR
jgi:hypothetical protein